MRLAYVDLCGFRGYRKQIRIEFADRVTIIDGRNGVGKSTIFDAVEYALTGALSKYKDNTAAGQTVSDYLWWAGGGAPPEDRYVDVGFTDGAEELKFGARRLTDLTTQSCEKLALSCVIQTWRPNLHSSNFALPASFAMNTSRASAST